jgi:FkbM family methyltransferase
MEREQLTKLADLFGLNETVNIADIGAAATAEAPIYKELVLQGKGHLFAFDGDQSQIQKIVGIYGPNVTVIDHFLGDGLQHTAYICHGESGMTSLLKPNQKALNFFNGFSRFGEVIREEQVQTTKLNDVTEINQIHFLKMDIQGSELSVLKHGVDKLVDCVAIQLEISYIPLYENQPTFGEVDVWMRHMGFAPHCFLDIKRWSISPTVKGGNFRDPFNQLLESDIVYIRDPLNLESIPSSQIRILGLLADIFFRSPDLAIHCIRELVARKEMDEVQINAYIALQ